MDLVSSTSEDEQFEQIRANRNAFSHVHHYRRLRHVLVDSTEVGDTSSGSASCEDDQSSDDPSFKPEDELN